MSTKPLPARMAFVAVALVVAVALTGCNGAGNSAVDETAETMMRRYLAALSSDHCGDAFALATGTSDGGSAFETRVSLLHRAAFTSVCTRHRLRGYSLSRPTASTPVGRHDERQFRARLRYADGEVQTILQTHGGAPVHRVDTIVVEPRGGPVVSTQATHRLRAVSPSAWPRTT